MKVEVLVTVTSSRVGVGFVMGWAFVCLGWAWRAWLLVSWRGECKGVDGVDVDVDVDVDVGVGVGVGVEVVK